jgi:uncharacterized protein YkwD
VRRTTPRRLRRLAPVVLTGLALTGLVLTGMPAAAVAASPCASAAGNPSTMTAAAVRADTLCLLNQERAAHGLSTLKLDRRLTRTALGHSREMVAERYFEHDSLSGQPYNGRIAATGWMNGRPTWIVGENLAWGSGSRATPRAIMNAWMHSPGHRHNILQRRFNVVGIGVEYGTPVAGPGNGITYTTDFGS